MRGAIPAMPAARRLACRRPWRPRRRSSAHLRAASRRRAERRPPARSPSRGPSHRALSAGAVRLVVLSVREIHGEACACVGALDTALPGGARTPRARTRRKRLSRRGRFGRTLPALPPDPVRDRDRVRRGLAGRERSAGTGAPRLRVQPPRRGRHAHRACARGRAGCRVQRDRGARVLAVLPGAVSLTPGGGAAHGVLRRVPLDRGRGRAAPPYPAAAPVGEGEVGARGAGPAAQRRAPPLHRRDDPGPHLRQGSRLPDAARQPGHAGGHREARTRRHRDDRRRAPRRGDGP